MEKEQALEILEQAVKSVDAAMNAIDNFAEANGVQLGEGKAITLDELIDIVAEREDMCCHCTAKVLTCAFSFLKENKLGLIMEEDEDA